MNLEEIRTRLSQGWTFDEARMGKGWQARYPNIASWPGGYSLAGTAQKWTITLLASCGSQWNGFHNTTYTLLEADVARIPDIEIYEVIDQTMKTWIETNGLDTILRFKRGW